MNVPHFQKCSNTIFFSGSCYFTMEWWIPWTLSLNWNKLIGLFTALSNIKMVHFAKIINFFHKTFRLRCLTGFWVHICPSFAQIFLNFQNYLLESNFRSSLRRCSIKKGVLRNFAKLTGKQLCQSLLFNKVADFRPSLLLKRDSGTGVFLWMLRNF